jgi:hypothetical protein
MLNRLGIQAFSAGAQVYISFVTLGNHRTVWKIKICFIVIKTFVSGYVGRRVESQKANSLQCCPKVDILEYYLASAKVLIPTITKWFQN